MHVFLKTFGCTLNNADSDVAKACLTQGGHTIVNSPSEAEVSIVSTCAVKGATERKILDYLKKLNASGAKLIVTGCLPYVSLDKIKAAASHASAIMGVNCASKIQAAVERASNYAGRAGCTGGSGVKVDLSGSPEEKFSLPRHHEGVIARIAAAYGCLDNCAYCCVKEARGSLKSVPLKKIVKQVEDAVAKGAKEIQLTAQDLGCYGLDNRSNDCSGLAELLNAVSQVEGNFFVRVGMMNPSRLSNQLSELIEAFKSEKIYKFFHVPVQSGSDAVLQAMNRGYNAHDFIEITKAFRQAFSEATIATDVIAGFPSESLEDFQKTVELIEKTKPDVVNVSQFSARPNTRANTLKQLPSEIVKERSTRLSEISRAIALEKNKALVGRRYRVLVTEKARNCMSGRNENYKTVLVQNACLGEVVNVEVRGAGVCHLKAF